MLQAKVSLSGGGLILTGKKPQEAKKDLLKLMLDDMSRAAELFSKVPDSEALTILLCMNAEVSVCNFVFLPDSDSSNSNNKKKNMFL